jgi:hypothetical protein
MQRQCRPRRCTPQETKNLGHQACLQRAGARGHRPPGACAAGAHLRTPHRDPAEGRRRRLPSLSGAAALPRTAAARTVRGETCGAGGAARASSAKSRGVSLARGGSDGDGSCLHAGARCLPARSGAGLDIGDVAARLSSVETDRFRDNLPQNVSSAYGADTAFKSCSRICA